MSEPLSSLPNENANLQTIFGVMRSIATLGSSLAFKDSKGLCLE